MTVILVRHAVALARKKWAGDDDLRPLTRRGARQAQALVDKLDACSVDRIYSSPAVRCFGTVEPLARARGLQVEVTDVLAEGTEAEALALVEAAEHVMLCGHDDNLPPLLLELAGHLDEVRRPVFAKGSAWIVDRDREGKVVSARYVAPPK